MERAAGFMVSHPFRDEAAEWMGHGGLWRRPRLPDRWRETGADSLAILFVPGQAFAEKLLLVEKPQCEDEDHGQDGEEAPRRGERERGADEHDESAGVHGMADDGVGAGGDDGLVGGDSNGCGGVGVFFEDDEDDEEAGDDKHVSRDDGEDGDLRPGEAMVESRDDQLSEEGEGGYGLDELLGRFLLCGGAGAHPALEERAIFVPEINGDGRRGRSKEEQVDPGLPEMDGPRWKEEQGREADEELQEAESRFGRQAFHASSLRPR